MRTIALTGTVAAGKSTVAGLFRRLGATVIDADAIVRELQQPGEPVFDAIIAVFGSGVRRADGGLDRAALRARVLADPDERAALERIVHPAVETRRRALQEQARSAGARVVVAEMPLLFEAADPSEYDGVIVVDAPVAERRRRLIAERGLDRATADALMASQWTPQRKRERATWVIDNDGDRATLESRTRDVWKELVH